MRVLALIFVLFAFAGCKATADRTVTEYKKVNKVEFVQFDHDVMYRNGEPRPSVAEEERLDAFLQNIPFLMKNFIFRFQIFEPRKKLLAFAG